MKKVIGLCASVLLGLISVMGLNASAQADHSQFPVSVQVIGIESPEGQAIASPMEGQPVVLKLKLINERPREGRSRQVIAASDLVVRHEKLIHFFGYDRALTNFVHEHPEETSEKGIWKVAMRFKRTGTYRLWADLGLKAERVALGSSAGTGAGLQPDDDGAVGALGSVLVQVGGVQVPNGPLATLIARPSSRAVPTESSWARGSRVELQDTSSLRAGEMAMVPLRFLRADQSKPEITPYLGAIGHFVIVNLKGSQVFHVHPMQMDMGAGPQWMLHVTLPKGAYRVFAQFMDGGVLQTAELAIVVK